MAVVACPKCDTMTEGELIRGDVVECGQCQHKFVVTLKTLLNYDEIVARKAPPVSKIYRPHEIGKPKSITCPFCKSELEGDVNAGDEVDCPECDKTFTARIIPNEISTQPKGMSKLFKVFMAIFGVILVYGIVASRVNRDPNDHSTAEEGQANYEKYVAKSSPSDKNEDYFSAWDGSNSELVAYVKNGMKDPSSFEHVETRFNNKGDHYEIRMVFRGKNSFNAVVTQTVIADLDKATRKLSNIQEIK